MPFGHWILVTGHWIQILHESFVKNLGYAMPSRIWAITAFRTHPSAARTAFRIAFPVDRPWLIMHTPFTPSKGAPPNSDESIRRLKRRNVGMSIHDPRRARRS